MTDWPVKTLGDVVRFDSETARPEDLSSRDVYVGLENIASDGTLIGLGNVSAETLKSNKARFTDNHILFGKLRPYLVKVVRPDFSGVCSTDILPINPSAELSRDFLYWYMRRPTVIESATEASTGTTLPRVSPTTLKTFEIAVPPLEEQKRIVELLDDATARVTELTACYEQARTHANNLFISALRDALENNPDWPVKTLGDVVSFDSETARPDDLSSRDIYVGLENIASDGTLIGLGNVSAEMLKSNKARFTGEHILFGKLRPYLVKVVRPDFRGVCSTDILPLKPMDELSRDYLYWYMRSPAVIKAATEASTGATLPRVSPTTLKSFKIPVPPLEEQKRIVASLDLMRAKTSEMFAAYDAKLTAARNLRQSILESAFAGDL